MAKPRANQRPRNRAAPLISMSRRSAEEYVSEDWSAVAKAINERLTVLGLNQRELAERSHVALSIVREIRNNTVQRRRAAERSKRCPWPSAGTPATWRPC